MSSSIKIFNSISKIYGWFFNFQIGYYEKIIENWDYFSFIKVVKDELNNIFKEVRVINVDTRAVWYICNSEKSD